MSHKIATFGLCAVMLAAGAAVAGDAAADKKKGEEMHQKAMQVRTAAGKNHEEAIKHLTEAGKEEETADKQYAEANKLDREARLLLKEAAENAEAVELWHRANVLARLAALDEIAARNHKARAHRHDMSAKDISAAATKVTAAANAEPDPKEKARLQKEGAALQAQSKDEEADAQLLMTEATSLEAAAKKRHEEAKAAREKAVKLDPDLEKRHGPGHAATAGEKKG